MPTKKKRSISEVIEKAARKLKVFEASATIVPIATFIFTKAILDKGTSGYNYDFLADHIIFEAARQSDIPMTKEDFERLAKRKLTASALEKVRDLVKKLGYEVKPINIVKIAENLTNRVDFPKVLSEKFVEMIGKLLELGYPQRENPKVAVAAVLCLTAELLGVEMIEASAARVVFKERRSRRSNLVHIKQFKPIAKKILGRVYEWKN